VVSNIPGAVYRRSLDADMTIEFVSDTVEAITGYAAASLIDSTDGGPLAFETSPGAGTTFTIRLPIAGAQAAAA
jgi:hypothetical protein